MTGVWIVSDVKMKIVLMVMFYFRIEWVKTVFERLMVHGTLINPLFSHLYQYDIVERRVKH